MAYLRLILLAAALVVAPVPSSSVALPQRPDTTSPAAHAAPVTTKLAGQIFQLSHPLDTCLRGDDLCELFAGDHDPERGGAQTIWNVGGSLVPMTQFQAWRQMRCLAYTAWAEARGEGTIGMLAVMEVIVNRAAARGHPATVCLNVSKRGQFEALAFKQAKPWLTAARNRDSMVPNIVNRPGPDARAARAARILAWRLLTGQIKKDIVKGATFYATKALVESGKTPRWIRTFSPVATVGAHVFFSPAPAEERLG